MYVHTFNCYYKYEVFLYILIGLIGFSSLIYVLQIADIND